MMATAGAIDLKFDVTAGAKRAVVVDLSNVAFKASLGIRLHVMGAKTITRKGGKLVILSPDENVHAVLKTAGIGIARPPSKRSVGNRVAPMTACAKEAFRSAIRIRNDSAEVDKLTQWIIEACDAAQLSKKTAFAVQLCLNEAVANILEHGKGSARASAIAADLE
jgi:anti-anti-sigma factor